MRLAAMNPPGILGLVKPSDPRAVIGELEMGAIDVKILDGVGAEIRGVVSILDLPGTSRAGAGKIRSRYWNTSLRLQGKRDLLPGFTGNPGLLLSGITGLPGIWRKMTTRVREERCIESRLKAVPSGKPSHVIYKRW